MAKYTSITISGPIASGTTTAAKILSQKLNLTYRGAGEFFRSYMQKHNIPLPNKEEIPDNIERALDEELTDLLKSKNPVVVDGLYAGYFARYMPHVLKVKFTADEAIRVKRANERDQNETEADLKRRDKAHDLKFRKLYANEDFLDPKFFDLVIDNTNLGQQEVSEKIIAAFKKS